MDLPVWQSLYEELQDKNFVIIAVAFDRGEISSIKEWIDKAQPAYPCLIDKNFTVAELYNMVNVPNAVWINELGEIVRAVEPAGWNDAWRTGNLTELEISKNSYFDALRNWVQEGDKSKYVLTSSEVINRVPELTNEHALAMANFRMGLYLIEHEDLDRATLYFNNAISLRPESWNFKRQSWALINSKEEQRTKFREALSELEDRPYYPILELKDSDKK
jgi:hypothetical protein